MARPTETNLSFTAAAEEGWSLHAIEVNGQRFTGQYVRWPVFAIGVQARSAKYAAAFPVGSAVEVQYNPANVAESFLKPNP